MAVTLEDLETFLRQPVPRTIPTAIRRRGLGGGMGLFGLLFGGLFATVGIAFSFIFFPWQLRPELALDFGRGAEHEGVVVAVHETNMKINDVKVRRVVFEFTVTDGDVHRAECYYTGQPPGPGAEVTVETVSGRPDQSRIEGGRINTFGYFGSFTIVFPIVGFGVLGWTVIYRRRRIRILRDGEFALGTLREVTPTSMRVNNQIVYRLKIDATIDGKPKALIHRCHGEAASVARDHHRNEEPVGLLLDPEKRSRVLLVDTLLSPS